jgi:hypothetical protein
VPDAGRIFERRVKRLVYADGLGFVRSVEIEIRYADMSSKSNYFFGNGIFKSGGYRYRENHHGKSQGNADDGNTYNGARKIIPFSRQNTLCYEKFKIQCVAVIKNIAKRDLLPITEHLPWGISLQLLKPFENFFICCKCTKN